MKNLNSYLTAFFLSLSFLSYSNTNPELIDSNITLVKNIETYLDSSEISEEGESVTVYSNFLVKEEGDIYTVDFILTETGKIVLLSKNIEEEYYIMDTHSTQNLIKTEVPVANVF